ncbi:phage tail protein [Heliobacterium mobile]|uniref:phage tail protein n=1 Tax=Heliobacterium mobile TaxID=28064 RepID=UPI0014794307|nr:phage tail protein [Heliobacterium mobile]
MIHQPAISGSLREHRLFGPLDCGKEGTPWHKVVADAHYPGESQVRFSYFCSDDRAEGDDSAAIPFSKAILNPKDALLLGAKGRYLWFRLELIGKDKELPVINQLKIYFPRFSYLNYLPALYQQDKDSADFLERFLSLFGTFLEDMDGRIEHSPRMLEPASLSGDPLRWLAQWLGMKIKGPMDDQKIRRLIAAAPEIYRFRGTRRSIELLIEIYTGTKPIIVEYYQYKHLLRYEGNKKWLTELFGGDPHCFCVLLYSWELTGDKPSRGTALEEAYAVVTSILEEQKPAFTEAKVIIVKPWICLDGHSYLGMNSFLQEPSSFVLDDNAQIPYNTMLTDL